MNPIGNIVDKEGQANIVDLIYPVGSIYLSVNSANPSTLFGGTWEAWGTGKVPVGIDTSDTDFNTVEKTGGAKTVTLTSAQSGVPAHSHGIPALSGTANNGGGHTHYLKGKPDSGERYMNMYDCGKGTPDPNSWFMDTFQMSGTANGTFYASSDGSAHSHTVTTNASTANNNTAANASQAHTNVQPYITCYMWKRTV